MKNAAVLTQWLHIRARASTTICSKWTPLSFPHTHTHTDSVRTCAGKAPYWIPSKLAIRALLLSMHSADLSMPCDSEHRSSTGAVANTIVNPTTVTINESMIFKLEEHTMTDWQPDRDSLQLAHDIRTQHLPYVVRGTRPGGILYGNYILYFLRVPCLVISTLCSSSNRCLIIYPFDSFPPVATWICVQTDSRAEYVAGTVQRTNAFGDESSFLFSTVYLPFYQRMQICTDSQFDFLSAVGAVQCQQLFLWTHIKCMDAWTQHSCGCELYAMQMLAYRCYFNNIQKDNTALVER